MRDLVRRAGTGLVLWAGCCWPGWASGGAASNASLAAPQVATAQLKSMSLEQLGNIKVTSVSKQPEEVWHTPAAVYVITHEDIVRSGATTIPELLRMVPGVQVSREQSDQWAIGIRGFDSPFSKGLLVLIDGRSVYTPLFEGVYWDVQDLPLEDIQRIEVIRGPGGTIWGPNAVNGVINIITRPAADTQGQQVNIEGGGAVEHFTGTVQYGFSAAPDLQFRVFARGFNRGSELNPGHDPYDTWHQERGGFRMDWNPGARDTVTATGMMYRGGSGEQIRVTQLLPPRNLGVDAQQAVAGGDLMVRWDHELAGGSDFYVESYFDRTNRNTPQFAETRNTFDIDGIYHLARWSRQDVILGAGLRESPAHFEQKVSTLDISPHDLNDYLYSLFAQDAIDLLPHSVTLTLGSKWEDNNFSGWGVEPSMRLLWNPRRNMTLWGAVTRALRTPGQLDTDVRDMVLASSRPPIFEQVIGNPNFKPEVLIGWEAGYRQLLGSHLYVDVAAYHNQYDDVESYSGRGPTISHPTTPYPYTLYTFQYANGLKGVTDGVEISPDWKPTNWLELKGSYSHLHMQLHSKAGFRQGAYAAADMGFAPDHMGSVESVIALPHRVEIVPDFRYSSALPADNIPSWETADLHVSWGLTEHLGLELTGRNLLQPYHYEGPGDNGNQVGIRRDIYAGLRWTP